MARARALIELTLEVDADGVWGEECTIGQMHSQASNETVAHVKNVLQGKGVRARIVGTPKVKMIVAEDV